MNNLLFVTLVTLVALQASNAQSPLDELIRNTETVVNSVSQTVGIKEFPQSKKVVEILKQNAQVLSNSIEKIVDKLKDMIESHQSEIDAIKQVVQKLSDVVTILQQASGIDAVSKVKELKKYLDDGLQTALAQVLELVKTVEPKVTEARTHVQSAAQTLLKQIGEVSNNVQTLFKAEIQ